MEKIMLGVSHLNGPYNAQFDSNRASNTSSEHRVKNKNKK